MLKPTGELRVRVHSYDMKTLYLDANGFGKDMVRAQTVLRGIFRQPDGSVPPPLLRRSRRVRAMYGYLHDAFAPLSYVRDWREAFVASPRLDVDVVNINNLVEYGAALARIREYDLVIVSHAASGDDMTVLRMTERLVARRRGKLVVFIGNEYDLLDDKIAFLRNASAEFVCSQLPIAAAQYLYGEVEGTRLLEMPHALNPSLYSPQPRERSIDIGFIGDIYWPFVGDQERTLLIRHFEESNHGLRVDIQKKRIDRVEWAEYLRNTHAIIGAESGTYYLTDRGRVLQRARAYNLDTNRAATFEDVYERFFAGVPRVDGKSISSRHFEPIGTKTCQILLEGKYNGVLQPEVHYIAVRRDLSDVAQAVERFSDVTYRQRIVEQAYEHTMAHHTYQKRVEKLVALVG